MGKLDQLAKDIFGRETPAIVGDRLTFTVPPETPTTEVSADGLLTVRSMEGLGEFVAPWRLAQPPEIVLEIKMQGDKVDRLEVERALLRRQARQVARAARRPRTGVGSRCG